MLKESPTAQDTKENRKVKNKMYEPNHSDLESMEEPILEALKMGRAKIAAPMHVDDDKRQDEAEKEVTEEFIQSMGHGGEEFHGDEDGSAPSTDSSEASFGLEGPKMSRRRRTWVEQNAKKRRILDHVQDQIQEVWDRGHRVRITVEAIHRTVPDDSMDLDAPIALDANDCAGEKGAAHLPDRNDDGMEGEG